MDKESIGFFRHGCEVGDGGFVQQIGAFDVAFGFIDSRVGRRIDENIYFFGCHYLAQSCNVSDVQGVHIREKEAVLPVVIRCNLL